MSENVKVKVLFFAKSRELVGLQDTEVETKRTQTLAQLLNTVLERYPTLAVIRNNIILAHNQEYLENWGETLYLQDGDEIAIIPPLSGG